MTVSIAASSHAATDAILAAGARAQPVFFRGDLLSSTGYAKAARALAGLVARFRPIVGVDIHPDPTDCSAKFPGPTMDRAGLAAAVAACPDVPIVIHYTGPGDFHPVCGAYNIGCFYWETDAIPYGERWPELIAAMDEIWAPSSFVAEFTRHCGFQGPLRIVTWPHDLDPVAARAASAAEVPAVLLELTGGGLQIRQQTAMDVGRSARNVVLAVQSLAARKGLPTLLAEWRRYLDRGGGDDLLLLRLAFRHTMEGGDDPWETVRRLLTTSGFRDGEPVRIAIIDRQVSDDQLSGLYRLASAYITATYGEGFGGPIVEALRLGCPVIAPRHTGTADLLAPDYPLIIPSMKCRVGLRGNLPVYPPSSSWHVPLPGAVADALERFAAMSTAERQETVAAARRHLAAFCGERAVLTVVDRFFQEFERGDGNR